MGKSTTWIAMFNSIKSYVCMFTRPGTCLKSHFVEISWILISHFVEVFLPGSVMRWPTTEFELAPRVSQGYPRCETDQLINLTQTFIPCLVVEPPLWKIWKSVGMIISNIWKNKKCSKPPTREFQEERWWLTCRKWSPSYKLVSPYVQNPQGFFQACLAALLSSLS